MKGTSGKRIGLLELKCVPSQGNSHIKQLASVSTLLRFFDERGPAENRGIKRNDRKWGLHYCPSHADGPCLSAFFYEQEAVRHLSSIPYRISFSAESRERFRPAELFGKYVDNRRKSETNETEEMTREHPGCVN
jgi:hypothetical protein